MSAAVDIMAEARLCVGAIVGAHGVRGDVRIKSFTADPGDLIAYGPLSDAGGERIFRLTLLGRSGGLLRGHIEGVDDRDSAQALAGVELYVERSRLPAPGAEEYYHSDLIGLRAEREDGSVLGTIAALYDFGAGDMIEISLNEGGTAVLPFTGAVFPVIDIDGGRVVVRPPQEVEAKPDEASTVGTGDP